MFVGLVSPDPEFYQFYPLQDDKNQIMRANLAIVLGHLVHFLDGLYRLITSSNLLKHIFMVDHQSHSLHMKRTPETMV